MSNTSSTASRTSPTTSSRNRLSNLSRVSVQVNLQVNVHLPAKVLDHDIEYPGQHDVLLGRGGHTACHPGNVQFRALLNQYREQYRNENKMGRLKIVQEIVAIWRERGPTRGRFLTMTEPAKGSDSLWHDVGDEEAIRRTAQNLRQKRSFHQPSNFFTNTNTSSSSLVKAAATAVGHTASTINTLNMTSKHTDGTPAPNQNAMPSLVSLEELATTNNVVTLKTVAASPHQDLSPGKSRVNPSNIATLRNGAFSAVRQNLLAASAVASAVASSGGTLCGNKNQDKNAAAAGVEFGRVNHRLYPQDRGPNMAYTNTTAIAAAAAAPARTKPSQPVLIMDEPCFILPYISYDTGKFLPSAAHLTRNVFDDNNNSGLDVDQEEEDLSQLFGSEDEDNCWTAGEAIRTGTTNTHEEMDPFVALLSTML